MKHTRLLSLALAFAFIAPVAFADTITSTPAGGLWSAGSTWEGGNAPGPNDDAVIIGPVQVAGIVACRNLAVDLSGSVTAALVPPPCKVEVGSAVVNDGTIADGAVWLDIEIGGDLHNAGTWSNHLTTLTGIGDRELSDASIAGFASDFAVAAGAAGDITVTTPVTLAGNVDLAGLPLILQPDSHLTLAATIFSGDVLAGGNEIRFQSWSYLNGSTIDDAVLVGEARVAFNVVFTTRLTVKDRLENTTSTGGGAATVEGDLVNHGIIRNQNYSFFFAVHGDIQNDGTIAVPILELPGAGDVHRLSMSPDAILDSTVFLPEFQASTLIAETPVRFERGLGLGVGTLVLEPGASLHFGPNSGLGSGTIEANGNAITTSSGNSALSGVTIDRGVIGDYVAIHDDILCTYGLTVAGTLTGWPWAAADLTVEGRLRNEGTITDGDHPVRIVARNDLENLGSMDNARVVMAGSVDQVVATGAGIAVPEFVLASGLSATSHQWYRDGGILPTETGPSLTLNTVGPADHGRYHCEGDGQVSRNVVITEVLATTDVPGADRYALEQNHPNPFNPATNIAFRLDRSGPVSLVVYDLAGREIDRLVSGELGAGEHDVTWQPRGVASGIYVYRLRAEGVDLSRKCSLFK